MTTCSKNFDRLLQASCLGLVGILAVAGCGGSSSTSTVDASKTQDGNGSLNGPDSGNVIPPAGTLTIDKVSIPFGSIDVGATSDAQTVTVTNSGTQAVAIAPSISSGSGAFTISSNCASVPAATGTVPGTCQISITFAPTATGNQTAILTVTSTLTVALKGDGVPPGSFDVANVNLGSQVLTNTAVTGAVTVTITGNVTDLACSVSGADLTADSTKVCPAVLPAGGSCTVGFTFKATTPGPKSDSVTCNAAGVHKTAVVSATVVDTAKLAITPATGSFQTQNGVQSADVPFGVANVGGLSTGTIQATITGTNADQFLISVPGCLAPLAGTTGCSLEVACKPTSVGTKTASLSVADSSGAAATVTAALTCVSVGPTSLTVTGTANLGSVVIGSTGTPQNFTVKNTGTTNSGTLTVTLSDTADFVKGSDGCNGASLDPNATCSIVVSLRPASAGALNAILNVAAASGNPGSIQLTGVGLTAGALTLSGSSYDFGPIPIGSASADVSFTVTNGGGAATGALTVSSPGNGFIVAGNGCSAALAPGKTCVFAIHFAPTVEGNATGTVTVGDLTVVSQPLTLHGTGTPTATLTIDPTSTCAAPEDLPTIPPPPASVGQNHALHETPSCGSSFPATVIGQTNGSYGAGGTGGAGGTSGSAGSSGSNTGIMFAVTNAGDIDTGAVTVKITGDASGDFVVVNNQCGANIVKSLDCIFYVNFTPTAAGARTATLTVTTVKGGNATVSLNGLGLPVIEILPCSNADGTIVGSEDIAGTSLINDDSDSSNWYAVYGTCTPLDATGGTDFGQVPLGVLGVLNPGLIPNQEKAFAVRVRGSSAANHVNTLTLSLTSANPDFSVATANESGGILSNVNCQGFQADVTSGVQECIVLLDFYPQSTLGNKTGILTITGSAGGSATVNLSGTASGPLTFSADTLDTTKNAIVFPDTAVGTVALDSTNLITETVVVTNYGTTAQGPLSFTVTGANSAEFATVMDNCSDKTLDAAGCSKSTETDSCNSCSMSFIMIPASAGAKTALLTVTSGTLSSQVTFSGNGTQGQTSTNPISVAPTSKDFGNVAIKAPSAYQTFTVTLSGTTETGDIDYGLWGTNCVNSAYACNGFEIAQAAGSGPDAVGTCGISDTRHLGGANPTSCTIKVRFNPAALQDGTAGLDPNDVGLWVEEMRSEQEVDIGLTGVATPQLVISPSTYDFTTGIPSGQTSTIVTFTVTNVGASPYIQADSLVYSIAGEGSAPLNTNGASTTCGTSLDAGAKCYVAVSITAPKLDDAANPPEITRDISTTLYVGDAGGAACTICGNATITATVVKPPTIEVVGFTTGLATYGNTVDFGTVPQGGSSSNVTIWYTNSGAVPATGFHYLWTDESTAPSNPPILSQDANDPYFPFISDSSSTACVNQNGTNLASLAPGGLCTATFHLAAASGAVSLLYKAKLDVWADNATHAKSITAQGHSTPNTGVPTITPSFFNFSPTTSTASGQKTAAQLFTLTAGNIAIPHASVALLASITDFDVALNPGGASPCSNYASTTDLAANGTCNFSVTFHPATSGPDRYRLGSIGTNDGTNSAFVGFIGKVSRPANLIIIDPTTTGTDFGDVLWNTKSAAVTLTITNTGEVASDAVTLAVGALDSGHAELSPEPNEVTAGYFAPSTNCNGVINPGATCSFTLTVQPGTTGQFPSVAGSIVVEARPAGWPGNAAEAWSGPVTARGVNAAALSLRPLNPPAFADQPVGSKNGTSSAVFTIQNGNASAPAPTQASGPLTITIDDTTNYVLTTGGAGGCTTQLDPNGPGLGDPGTAAGQCTVEISFKPSLTTTLGNHPVNLTVTSKTKTGVTLSATVQVAGKVVAPLAFVIKEDVQDPNYPLFAPLASATTDFGSVAANAVISSDQTTGFQVGDPGVMQLWVQDSWAAPDTGLLTTTLSGAGFRIIWNNCVGVQLGYDNDGSQFCDVGIRFEPTSAGAKSGSLVVSGTPGGSVTMALTGTGL